ncbi:BgTH12-01399 [Blumeria graminis f. sp. triticale]|uniref:BgTH12-01399 n=1 Tax=Blumeria graminis f. sp. triticale TaxID=1689686 RepID=A0A9W4CYD6_BLUGR|nr:BgTH12-01399 [Blumeria graminis f. sp. triticale]
MKILGAVSASAFTFLLLLESVEPSNVFKCASGDIFYMGAIYDLALKAEYQFSCPDHPLSPDGEKCKAYSFTNPSEISQSSSLSAYTITDNTHLDCINGMILNGLNVNYRRTIGREHNYFPNEIKGFVKLPRHSG